MGYHGISLLLLYQPSRGDFDSPFHALRDGEGSVEMLQADIPNALRI